MNAKKGKTPDCDKCRPYLLPSNYPVISIIDRFGSGMVNGMGGINTHGVESALNYEYWMNPMDRSIMYQKILTYLHTILRVTDKNYVKEPTDGKKVTS